MPNPDLTKLTLKNLLSYIHGAVGTELFQNIYVRDSNGRQFDALAGGERSCAYVVSTILTMCGLIDRPHAVTATTLEAMKAAGWQAAEKPVAGAVACWPPSDSQPAHIGFYLDEQTYMSNSSAHRVATLHGPKLADGRLPAEYYVHPELLAGPGQNFI